MSWRRRLDAVIGGLLSILMIFLFLRDGWSTFVISLSLPVSIIATFFFMGQFGLSLNVMSLGGWRSRPASWSTTPSSCSSRSPRRANAAWASSRRRSSGTSEVGMAVVASLTTIAVFLPLVFVQGIAGQLFRDQALTVSIAIG
jgi:HAE1 family hydrophobic/amphiphilic exporter-1